MWELLTIIVVCTVLWIVALPLLKDASSGWKTFLILLVSALFVVGVLMGI